MNTNRALCSKSKSDKPNSFKWLHSIPKALSIKHHWRPAACEENKEAHTQLGWRLGAETDEYDGDFLNSKVTLQMQSGIAAGTVVSITEREGICSGERERECHFRKGLYLSHHLCQCVCVHQQAEQQSCCRALQDCRNSQDL